MSFKVVAFLQKYKRSRNAPLLYLTRITSICKESESSSKSINFRKAEIDSEAYHHITFQQNLDSCCHIDLHVVFKKSHKQNAAKALNVKSWKSESRRVCKRR